jgi:hypothetical protein
MSDTTILSLEVLKAKKGDCLLLHYGADDERKLWVIDGGPSGVYKPALKKRLDALRGGAPLEIALLMVSHHDDDHIKGVLELCEELETAKAQQTALPYVIHNLWHNSFQNLVDLDDDDGDDAIVPASLEAGFGGTEHDRAMLASVDQGHRLGAFARLFDWPVNRAFAKKIAGFGQVPPPNLASFAPLAITMVGPMQTEVDALREVYRKFLEKRAAGKLAEADAVLAAYADSSPANLSSIVALVELDGKTILLTGDARGDTVLEALRELDLIGPGKVLKVDVLKLPHHGSDRNVEPDFFENIHADHYVFCGDGSHVNPERETLAMLFGARGTAAFTLHFNYALTAIDVKRASEWDKEEVKKKKRKASHRIRPWDQAKQGLATFLDAQRAAGGQFTVIEASAPGQRLVIDLLDPLGN